RGLGCIERRVTAVFLLEIGYEFFVGLVRQVDHPMLRSWYAERHFAETRQRQRIDDEGGVERDPLSQAELRILGEKLDAGRTWIESEDRVGFCRARLRQFRREVELVRPPRVILAKDLTRKFALRPAITSLPAA